ncbi:Oidioi.mRNA.OKI2018_I69.chr2.g5208.t1.cds [Oikopleura dioica]|uniref:Oidioi.mRNA.OKI2018_I69.chr2.g5208.t1.cds n=1 Tax=Oikopleura dioica TaxID=34765 RepID=A0ABN7SZE2_OIKDI|nr:Oidioi.mRNA.OKI2018_I69.chr2.g5208.t1.cds [Oikopleura dioica]
MSDHQLAKKEATKEKKQARQIISSCQEKCLLKTKLMGERIESDTKPEKKKPKNSTLEPKSSTPTRKKSPARSQQKMDQQLREQKLDARRSSSRIRPSIIPAEG